jgi:pyruvate kinase
MIRRLLQAGMTVARINFSHGTEESVRSVYSMLRETAAAEGRNLAIMGDLQGPKIRVGTLPEEGVSLVAGAEVMISSGGEDAAQTTAGGGPTVIPFPHPEIMKNITNGDQLLLDDGNMELEVERAESSGLRCRVVTGGTLTSKKGVNLPGVKLDISALTEKDKADAALAVQLGFDFLALSFVRSREDLKELRTFLIHTEDGHPIRQRSERIPGENPHPLPSFIAKIEKPEALDDLQGIISSADAVMVARGDLGVEISPEQVPMAQKKIIRACNRMGKPVITATQMLQSMIDNPRPTRAEASDVANAILDGSDAVMLSGETSIGAYPVEATAFMSKIAEQMEDNVAFPYNQLMGIGEAHMSDAKKLPGQVGEDERISEAVSRVTVDIADSCGASAIVTSTESGRTAKTVARHRPRCPLLATTPFEETARRLQLVWGVYPVVVQKYEDTDQMIRKMTKACVDSGFARVGDEVILTAGIPFDVHGVTNMLKVHTIRRSELETDRS